MERCPACQSTVTPGATDCAVCGHLLAHSTRRTYIQKWIDRQPHTSKALVSFGIVTWVWFASIWLFYLSIVAFALSAFLGYFVAKGVCRSSSGFILMLGMLIVGFVAFYEDIGHDIVFGWLPIQIFIVHAGLILGAMQFAKAVNPPNG